MILVAAAITILLNFNLRNNNSYNDFLVTASKFQKEYNLTGYIQISPDGLTNNVAAFPSNLLLEKRTNDGIDNNPMKASKFETYYLKEDQSILCTISIVYYKSAQKGIIYKTITSPADNTYVADSYRELNRPYLVDQFVGCGNYSINMKVFLLNSDSSISESDNIMNLLTENMLIYRELEKFVLKMEENKLIN